MPEPIIKIVVIGPESTGKSTLCEQLANHFNTIWVKEYAREYLITNGTAYNLSDLDNIAAGQLASEDLAVKKLDDLSKPDKQHSLLFIDTDLYVVKVWSEFVFNTCSTKILNEISNRKYDLYLLCEPDIPWVKDDLREYPDLNIRSVLYHHYKDLLVNQKVGWENISGDYHQRLSKAIAAVNDYLSSFRISASSAM
jgi:NadR type nicotinamide-nucleotide adenylyltransferase